MKLAVVKASEFSREAAQRADETKLAGNDIGNETEEGFLCKCKPALGFALGLDERISDRQNIGVEIAAMRKNVAVAMGAPSSPSRSSPPPSSSASMVRPPSYSSASGRAAPTIEHVFQRIFVGKAIDPGRRRARRSRQHDQNRLRAAVITGLPAPAKDPLAVLPQDLEIPPPKHQVHRPSLRVATFVSFGAHTSSAASDHLTDLLAPSDASAAITRSSAPDCRLRRA